MNDSTPPLKPADLRRDAQRYLDLWEQNLDLLAGRSKLAETPKPPAKQA
jgi:hypothetical protein